MLSGRPEPRRAEVWADVWAEVWAEVGSALRQGETPDGFVARCQLLVAAATA